jgi:hypothetical protein
LRPALTVGRIPAGRYTLRLAWSYLVVTDPDLGTLHFTEIGFHRPGQPDLVVGSHRFSVLAQTTSANPEVGAAGEVFRRPSIGTPSE